MHVSSLRVIEVNIPLEPPLVVTTKNKKTNFTHRRGFYLVASHDNVCGVGEMVEPVFRSQKDPDSETVLNESLALARSLQRSLMDVQIDELNWKDGMIKLIDRVLPFDPQHMSLSMRLTRFALEQALLYLVARSTGVPITVVIAEWIGQNHLPVSNVLRINSMINVRSGPDNFDSSLTQTGGVIKVKVGGGDRTPERDANLINRISNQQKHRKAWLRLDANQSWSKTEADLFFKSLSPEAIHAIEYIEEPFNVESVFDLEAVMRGINLPVALDESLMETDIFHCVELIERCRIVNKTFLHGIRDSKLIHGRDITVSCTFETGIGLGFLVLFASVVSPHVYHGIHALPTMIERDEFTKRFKESVSHDEQGVFFELHVVEKLMYDFFDSL